MRKFLFGLALMMCASLAAVAQVDFQKPLELDKDVRVGKLDNGLTYYIRHNEKPKDRASFYLVTNVGAIQETPAQDGLAHFLEHMCLNGTKNFPGKGIISYMESIGAKFGANINASTGVEQTAYTLSNVPLKRQTVIDSSIFILHDYACAVTNDPKEIDSERGVIVEEWRTRRDASQRNREAQMAVLYKDSKYATCNIIGTKENLETFKPEELLSFYKTWYRPDMQAVIVVGDVDVDYVEAKIKQYFNQIPKAENPKQKDVITIPGNEKPLVSIFTDKELNSSSTTLYIKYDPMPREYRGTGVALITDLIQSVVTSMMNERLSDLAKTPNAPFLGAGIGFYEIARPLEAFVVSVDTKDGEAINGFKSALIEVERAKRFGFTQEEFDRAKTNILKGLENSKNNADSRQNEQFCRIYMSNFTEGTPYLTPDYRYDICKQYLDIINLDMINQGMFPKILVDDNNVITYSAPEKEGLSVPTEQDFINAMAEAKAADVKPLEITSSNEPLMDASSLKGSKIKKEEKGMFGTTIYTLANGIKIYVKPTDFKKNEIIMQTVAPGGKSILPQELLPVMEENMFQTYCGNAGLSKFSAIQLPKVLVGKIASAGLAVGNIQHGVTAVSSPDDLETAFQLMYLYYTDRRVEQSELEIGLEQIKSVLPNMEKQPSFLFSKALQTVMANSPRNIIIDNDVVNSCSADKIKKALDMMYNDAAGTTMYIVGNVDLNKLKPLLEKYIGSLPVKAKKPRKPIDHDLYPVKGVVDKSFATKMETPKTSVAVLCTGYNVPNSVENNILLSGLKGVLDQLYTKTIREEEGGTYGVSVTSSLSGDKDLRDYILLGFVFDTDPSKAAKLIQLAKDGLKGVAENGPDAEYLKKTKENMIKNFPEKQISNSYWNSIIKEYYMDGKDYNTNYVQTVEKVMTVENIKDLAQKILAAGNEVDVVMSPAE